MMFGFTLKSVLLWLVLFEGISVSRMFFMPQLMGSQPYFAVQGAKNFSDKLESWSERPDFSGGGDNL
ncbi:hypothetical protein AKJ41_03380 [candidate division MSBL1 archaeon SCGC-AAA259O05]|uniref:Uncharacterized protein n=1 Tax=candidate division MSBL1 archaeon SCGC-AAA259O05 TaxID=1698271 RepID=A0A133V3E9_9EURY|nr:hypothetical protein AKJ41_03380 [candidate division MSBL1 archaeon SCGC-AAA259O05]